MDRHVEGGESFERLGVQGLAAAHAGAEQPVVDSVGDDDDSSELAAPESVNHGLHRFEDMRGIAGGGHRELPDVVRVEFCELAVEGEEVVDVFLVGCPEDRSHAFEQVSSAFDPGRAISRRQRLALGRVDQDRYVIPDHADVLQLESGLQHQEQDEPERGGTKREQRGPAGAAEVAQVEPGQPPDADGDDDEQADLPSGELAEEQERAAVEFAESAQHRRPRSARGAEGIWLNPRAIVFVGGGSSREPGLPCSRGRARTWPG